MSFGSEVHLVHDPEAEERICVAKYRDERLPKRTILVDS
jgi:hypothetical protein